MPVPVVVMNEFGIKHSTFSRPLLVLGFTFIVVEPVSGREFTLNFSFLSTPLATLILHPFKQLVRIEE